MLREHFERFRLDQGLAPETVDSQTLWKVVSVLARAWRERRQVLVLACGDAAALASEVADDLRGIVVQGLTGWRVETVTDCNLAVSPEDTDKQVLCQWSDHRAGAGNVVLAVLGSGSNADVERALRLARESGAICIASVGAGQEIPAECVDLCFRAPAQAADARLALHRALVGALGQRIAEIANRELCEPKALVLAAGEGTRLRPLTLDRPKPMVPINGKPLLEYTIGWFREHDVYDIAINLHYRPDAIVNHFGDGSAFGVRLAYSYEDPILGTAGALRKLNEFLGTGPVVIVYGDVLTDLDLSALLAFHADIVAHDPAAGVTLSLYHVPNPTEVGLVGLDDLGRVTRFLEKPRPEEVFTDLANAGVLVVEPWIVDLIPPDVFYDFGHHLFPRLLQSGVSIYGYVVPTGTYLLDIGSPEKYAQAQREWIEH